MKIPEASIVIPIHKDEGFFDACLNSLLNQNFDNFEIIIVANNCSDCLWNKINHLKDPRLTAVRTPLGQITYNLNYGICLAQSDVIVRMDSDDVAHPDRIGELVTFFHSNPGIHVVGSYYGVIDRMGNVSQTSVSVPTQNDTICRNLFYQSTMAQPTVAFRRKAFVSVGGYKFSSYAEDWDLWLRMRDAGFAFANIPKVLLYYRIHPEQETSISNFSRNIAYVMALYCQYFILTKNVKYLFGAICHLYVKSLSLIKRKILKIA